jgi:hypothetical protein
VAAYPTAHPDRDEFGEWGGSTRLIVHPIVLGSGQRLFGPAADKVSLTLVDTAATSTGVILATYRS